MTGQTSTNNDRRKRKVALMLAVIIALVTIIVIQANSNSNLIGEGLRPLLLQQQQQAKQELIIGSSIAEMKKTNTDQGYHYITSSSQPPVLNNSTTENTNNKSIPSAQTSSLSSIFKKVENSVVQITSRVSSNDEMQIIINGNPLQGQATRLGSGFVYDRQGHIITNDHVINGAKTVDITFVDGNTYTAKVIGTDRFNDVSVLQITDDLSEEKNLVPLVIGNSSNLEVGQQVIAIGNPFGLSDSMTTGIISQIGRLLPNPDTQFSIPNTIQTDATINPGNSGGPLLNMQGQVIGMNTAISSSTGDFAGVGFAIPSNTITRIVPSLLQKGTYSHPWLGISGVSITPDIAQSIGLPRNYKGVVVGSVEADGPADKAGLKGAITTTTSSSSGANPPNPDDITRGGGDIITAIDGHPVKRIDDLISYIEEHKLVGDNIVLTVNRNGQTTDLTATLQTRPTSLRS
jgi:S1-C subfamily serine protease